MQLLFVGDGPRDEVVVPAIVRSINPNCCKADFHAWKNIRLARSSGYERKLKFAIADACERGLGGVVATVDNDRVQQRDGIAKLQSARQDHRCDLSHSQIRIAIGEAHPHSEAWLLDDAKAVREVLGLDSSVMIPNVRTCHPKDELHRLVEKSAKADLEISLLREIAQLVSFDRCTHKNETGLEAFRLDVSRELF
jgi:hypothetical protein